MESSFSSFANVPPQRDEPQQMDDELVDVDDNTGVNLEDGINIIFPV